MSQDRAKLLSLPMAIGLVFGNIIGSGIFLLPATMAPYGGVSALGWVFTATGAMLLAIAFAWLARTQAVAGGIYAYTRMAFGDFAGFLVAWSYWISLWVTNAALATATVSYLSALMPSLAQSNVLAGATALSALWILTGVNIHGVRSAGVVQVVTSVLKLAPLLLLMLMGLLYMHPDNLVPFNPTGKSTLQASSAAAALALWSMLGLESATVGAAKVVDPERNVPRATLIGTAAGAIVTALVSVGAMMIVPPAILAKSNAPFADVANVVWGGAGGSIMACVGALSAFGCLNGWVLLQGQLAQAMARDRFLPPAFARENARATPTFAIIVGSVITSLMIMLNYTGPLVSVFTFLSLLATLATLVPYLLSAMAALLLLRKGPVPLTRGRVLVLLAASGYALWTIYGAGQEVVFWGFLLLLSGLPVFVWLRSGTASSSP